MPMQSVLETSTRQKLIPLYDSKSARAIPLNLAPLTTYPAGQIVGQTGTAANDVQTIADSGTVGGGTFTISGTNPLTGLTFTTAAIAYNANNAAVKAAIEAALGTGTVTVAGSGLPGNDTTITFSGTLASMPVPLMTIDGTSLTGTSPVLAITHTTTGRTAATYAKYVDGTNTADAILEYACVTDAAGRVTYATESEAGGRPTASAFVSGKFACADLTGLDAAAVTDLGANLVGPLATGFISF